MKAEADATAHDSEATWSMAMPEATTALADTAPARNPDVHDMEIGASMIRRMSALTRMIGWLWFSA